jgi:hypothetical protein
LLEKERRIGGICGQNIEVWISVFGIIECWFSRKRRNSRCYWLFEKTYYKFYWSFSTNRTFPSKPCLPWNYKSNLVFKSSCLLAFWKIFHLGVLKSIVFAIILLINFRLFEWQRFDCKNKSGRNNKFNGRIGSCPCSFQTIVLADFGDFSFFAELSRQRSFSKFTRKYIKIIIKALIKYCPEEVGPFAL